MWIQQTAELWLILQLTGRGTAVGLHSVLRFGPVFLLGAHGGLLSDRIARHRLLISTQLAYALSATVISIALWMDRPVLWLIYAVVLAQGLITAIDNPLRRAFVRDLVDDNNLANAVSLNSSVGTSTRAIGPAIAGLLIANVGVEWCFTINAISYVAVLAVLVTLDRTDFRPQVLMPRAPRQVREGIAFAWHYAAIREALMLCMIVGVFAWNWSVLIPFYVTEEFSGGATLYGMLLSTLSVGSVIGALFMARLRTIEQRHLVISGSAMAVAQLVIALAPELEIATIGLVLLGLTSTAVIVGIQARIHLRVADSMNGRVIALFSVLFVGSKPFGGIIAGWLTDAANSRVAFGVSAGVIGMAVATLWAKTRSSAPHYAAPARTEERHTKSYDATD